MRSVRSWLLVSMLVLGSACATSARDPHVIAADVEGAVSSDLTARLVQHADLAVHPLVVSVGDVENTYGPGDQPALEQFVREQLGAIDGTTLHVTQEVTDETGTDTARLTLTVATTRDANTRYVGVTVELLRTPHRLVVTRVRIAG